MAVPLPIQGLRRDIAWRATDDVLLNLIAKLTRFLLHRVAEVGDANVIDPLTARVKQDVLGLEVSMNESYLVHEVQREQYLRDYNSSIFLT